jgi:hypothetical protein
MTVSFKFPRWSSGLHNCYYVFDRNAVEIFDVFSDLLLRINNCRSESSDGLALPSNAAINGASLLFSYDAELSCPCGA